MSILTDMLKRLTDNYKKDPESNVGRLLNIVAGELEALKESIEKTRAWRDIDEAEGETLDRIGYNVQQWRGQAQDSVYRLLIKTKIARNLSDGSINTIIQILSVALGVEPEQITIEEMWHEEPATIRVIGLPLEQVSKSGMTLNQFGRMVSRVVAAGVRVSMIDMQGTFQFSSQIDAVEMDSEKGFNELINGEPGNVGGYFGAIYDPADDPELPI